MTRSISITREALVSLATALLLALSPGSVFAQDKYCDPQLGRNFDEQTDEVRMARMNLYFDCRQTQDFRFLENKQKHILTGIQRWQSRATLATRTTLRSKRNIFDTQLRTLHLGQRGDLAADYANQFAELDAARQPSNRVEIDQQRRELGITHSTARSEQGSRQRQEVATLRHTLLQCNQKVSNDITQLTNADSSRVREQFLAKGVRLVDEYRTVKGLPMNQTLKDYLAKLATDDGAIGTIAEMEGTGTITSGDGSTVTDASAGAEIHAGDVVKMDEDSGCSIVFVDHTATNVGSETRAELDEYIFDPDNDDRSGAFTFMRGIFVFTSGLIGRKEASDVDVSSEAIGNLGIRG